LRLCGFAPLRQTRTRSKRQGPPAEENINAKPQRREDAKGNKDMLIFGCRDFCARASFQECFETPSGIHFLYFSSGGAPRTSVQLSEGE
jgi:hypothetical protein